MDYFTDVLAMFLSLDRVRILTVYERVREFSGFIKMILICVLKMNEGFGMTWGWVINDRIVIFIWWTIPLTKCKQTLCSPCRGCSWSRCRCHMWIHSRHLQRCTSRRSRASYSGNCSHCGTLRCSASALETSGTRPEREAIGKQSSLVCFIKSTG